MLEVSLKLSPVTSKHWISVGNGVGELPVLGYGVGPIVGERLGAADGIRLEAVGDNMGAELGVLDGEADGENMGMFVGAYDGTDDGGFDGL